MIKNNFNDTNGFGEHKESAIIMFATLIDILDKHNIEYFLISGTLLGYQRHNDFIPWDDDIDIIVSEDFLNKKNLIFNELIDIHKEFKFHIQNPNYVYKFCFNNKIIPHKNNDYFWPFVDIFIYHTRDNTINFFNKDWDINEFFPAKKVLFNNINASVPKNPDYFLKKNYGENYMTIYKSSNWDHKLEKPIKKKINITDKKYKNYFK